MPSLPSYYKISEVADLMRRSANATFEMANGAQGAPPQAILESDVRLVNSLNETIALLGRVELKTLFMIHEHAGNLSKEVNKAVQTGDIKTAEHWISVIQKLSQISQNVHEVHLSNIIKSKRLASAAYSSSRTLSSHSKTMQKRISEIKARMKAGEEKRIRVLANHLAQAKEHYKRRGG